MLPLASSADLSRRRLLVAGAVTLAATQMRVAIAQTASRSWLDMVKTHHALVSKTMDGMLDAGNKTFYNRDVMQKALSYQLTAHSVAEENVLYPAIARQGVVSTADQLYLDQAHAKVMNAELDLIAEQNEGAWFDRLRSLQRAVIRHAKGDEEANVYPALAAKLDPATNAWLSAMYQQQFESVRPVGD